ncbi:Zinc finger protein [Plakobranchus ocellatus]|uniref:Zinc finger protein n=1 Tax=Plakobranchus ocellatus TaxID=259542 RepID=A0AAV4BQI9_9GAST|nr:Zinc finger protein [Plakobranchus ocellatus]
MVIRIDYTSLLAEKAVVNLWTPYLCGEVKVLCIRGAIYDVIVGNVEGARGPEDPKLSVMVGAATTQLESKPRMRRQIDRCRCLQWRHGGVDLVNLWTPYLRGEVKVLCIRGAIYDVIVGTVEGARGPEDPKMSVMVGAATTREQASHETATRSLQVPTVEARHRFFLTLVDYATRYAEAVPLRKIYAETGAEVLVDIYSRLVVPEEVLSDQGTQFKSDCIPGSMPPFGNQAEGDETLPPDV